MVKELSIPNLQSLGICGVMAFLEKGLGSWEKADPKHTVIRDLMLWYHRSFGYTLAMKVLNPNEMKTFPLLFYV
jgi:hypothetical protein